MTDLRLSMIGKTIRDLQANELERCLQQAMDANRPPLDIIGELSAGMDAVGELFKSGEYFLGELIFSGELFKNAMGRLEPLIKASGGREFTGKVIMGAVQGDIHDLGKNIVITLLECAGFGVIDLGVDAPPHQFVKALEQSNAPLVGMSGLITEDFASMKATVEAIKKAGMRDSVSIMIGGGSTSEEIKLHVGADFYGPYAASAVDFAKKTIR